MSSKQIESIRQRISNPLLRAIEDLRALMAAHDAQTLELEAARTAAALERAHARGITTAYHVQLEELREARAELHAARAAQALERARHGGKTADEWIDAHECEDVAAGALDAQAEAETEFFACRRALEEMTAERDVERARIRGVRACLEVVVKSKDLDAAAMRGTAEGILAALDAEAAEILPPSVSNAAVLWIEQRITRARGNATETTTVHKGTAVGPTLGPPSRTEGPHARDCSGIEGS